jgi:hypothetical protein
LEVRDEKAVKRGLKVGRNEEEGGRKLPRLKVGATQVEVLTLLPKVRLGVSSGRGCVREHGSWLDKLTARPAFDSTSRKTADAMTASVEQIISTPLHSFVLFLLFGQPRSTCDEREGKGRLNTVGQN